MVGPRGQTARKILDSGNTIPHVRHPYGVVDMQAIQQGTTTEAPTTRCLQRMLVHHVRHPYGVVKRADYSTEVQTTKAPTTGMPTTDACPPCEASMGCC